MQIWGKFLDVVIKATPKMLHFQINRDTEIMIKYINMNPLFKYDMTRLNTFWDIGTYITSRINFHTFFLWHMYNFPIFSINIKSNDAEFSPSIHILVSCHISNGSLNEEKLFCKLTRFCHLSLCIFDAAPRQSWVFEQFCFTSSNCFCL